MGPTNEPTNEPTAITTINTAVSTNTSAMEMETTDADGGFLSTLGSTSTAFGKVTKDGVDRHGHDDSGLDKIREILDNATYLIGIVIFMVAVMLIVVSRKMHSSKHENRLMSYQLHSQMLMGNGNITIVNDHDTYERNRRTTGDERKEKRFNICDD